MFISIGESFAQVKDTLYYNKEWKGVETKREAEYYRIVTFNSNGIPKGEILDYYKSGELQAKSESAKSINRFDDSKSIFVGKSIIYYKSGQIEEEYTHNAEGKVIGNYNDYYKSGKIKTRATFDLNGKIIGTAIYLYENGQVSKEIPYSKGKINGTVIYYSKTGIETAEINYVNGDPKYDWYIAFDKQGKSHKYNIKTNKLYFVSGQNKEKENIKPISKTSPQHFSLSLDKIMTKDEQINTGIIKLSDKERKNLEKWLKKWTLSVLTLTKEKEYAGVGSGHWISENSDGKIIELEDGSNWLVPSIDRIYSSLWLVTDEITVLVNRNDFYPYKLVNTDSKEVVEAKYIGSE